MFDGDDFGCARFSFCPGETTGAWFAREEYGGTSVGKVQTHFLHYYWVRWNAVREIDEDKRLRTEG